MKVTLNTSSKFITTFLILCLFVNHHCCQSPITVKTVKSENIDFKGVGNEIDLPDKTIIVASFLGIPFADPITNETRFAKPTLKIYKEHETIEAGDFKPMCQQKAGSSPHCPEGGKMSEDCLYLNIYVPAPTLVTTTTAATTATSTTSTTTKTTSTTSKTTAKPTTNKPATTPSPTHPDTTDTPEATTDDSTNTTQDSTGENDNTTGTSNRRAAPQQETDQSTTADQSVTLPVNKKYPVFVYIHGGAFTSGSGNCYDGSKLAAVGEIIVVTINYRLGPFGFLSTNDDKIPGNLGLWDQQVAIQWVNKNIHHFGGDPDKITVGGHSAGSYSTILQALYQPNDQLFKRVIAQSGTPAAKNSVSENGYDMSLAVAKSLGCNISGKGTSSQIKECLMKKSAKELAEASLTFLVPGTLPIGPTLEAPFISVDPYKVLSKTEWLDKATRSPVPIHFTDKDLLIGVVDHDGEIIYRALEMVIANDNSTTYKHLLETPLNRTRFEELVKIYIQSNDQDTYDDILVEAILDRYTDWQNPSESSSIDTIDMLTEVCFTIPTLDTASSHLLPDTKPKRATSEAGSPSNNAAAQVQQQGNGVQSLGGATYVYKITLPDDSDSLQNKPGLPWFEGSHYAVEVPYLFGQNEDNDPLMSYTIMTYWANFIKYGDPNGDTTSTTTSVRAAPQSKLPTWEAYTETDQQYLDISLDGNAPESKSKLDANGRHFWSDYIPKLGKSLAMERAKCDVKETAGNSGMKMSGHLTILPIVMMVPVLLRALF